MNNVFIPPYSVLETNVDITGQVIDYWHSLLGVQEAQLNNRGHKAVIYILDTAKEWLAPDLSKESNKYAFDATGQVDDAGNHGHLCAGIASALANDVGVLGVAPEALVIPVKALHVSSGSYDWIIGGLDYIKNHFVSTFSGTHVGIVNMSFGGTADYAPLKAKLQECVDAGLIPVAAAGNTGASVTYPGAWDELCITVPALDANSLPASFSAFGPATDVAAYGVSVTSTAPDGTYPRVSGTSFSSPMIAGVSAVVGTAHNTVFIPAKPTNKALMEEHLKKYAKDILDPGEDNKSGAGVAVIPPYLVNKPDQSDEEPPTPPDKEKTYTLHIEGELKFTVKEDK